MARVLATRNEPTTSGHQPEQEGDPGEALLGLAELHLLVRHGLHDEWLRHVPI